MATIPSFSPHFGTAEERVAHVERFLARYLPLASPPASQAAANSSPGPTPDVGNPPLSGGGELSPDVTGELDDNTVVQLQRYPLDDTAPAAGEYLGGGGSQWTPSKPVLAGDVTGDYDANTVEQVQGVPFPAPVAGDDGFLLGYDNSGPAYVWVDPASAAAGVQQLDLWFDGHLDAISTSPQEMPTGYIGTGFVRQGARMLRAGAVTAIGAFTTGDIGAAGGNQYEAELYINGSATGRKATIIGAGGTEDRASTTGFSESFAAGDILAIYDKRTGTLNASITSRASLLVEF